MRTWGSNTLKDSNRAGMSFGACGFNMAPALLLIFTRVLMLQTQKTQLLSLNKSNRPYRSHHEDILHFTSLRNIRSLSSTSFLLVCFFFLPFCNRKFHTYKKAERTINEILYILHPVQQPTTFNQLCLTSTSTSYTHHTYFFPCHCSILKQNSLTEFP